MWMPPKGKLFFYKSIIQITKYTYPYDLLKKTNLQ